MTRTLTTAALLALFATAARAEPRMWAAAGFGPAAGVAAARFETQVFGLDVEADYEVPTQIRLVQAFGYRLLGERSGPAASLELQESLGDRHVLFQIVPRFEWSFALPVKLPAWLQLDLTPSVGLGYIHFSRQASGGLGGSANGVTIQIAVEGRLFVHQRYFVSLRPIEIDIQSVELTSGQVQGTGTFVRYNLLLGGGVRF